MAFALYSDDYVADMGEHIFPVDKYRRLKERLLADGVLSEDELEEPRPATDEELRWVHAEFYLKELEQLAARGWGYMTPDTPVNESILRAQRLACGGTLRACELASKQGAAANLGGGFHHAFPDHGEGFCLLNDVAVGAKGALERGYARKIAVIDCDLHQGNATAAIFRQEPAVFTFSIHEQHNYPATKPPSDLDIGLPSGLEDEGYLQALEAGLAKVAEDFQPELILFVAGADVYAGDQLGRLQLSLAGIRARDEAVLDFARKAGAGVACVLGGGYAARVEDTVTIHAQTIELLHSFWRERN